MNTIFCGFCGREQEVSIQKKEKSFVVRGEKISAKVTIATCTVCHEVISDEKMEKENETLVYGEYRKKMNLLFPAEIKRIRDRYGISQAAFASFFGFGEKTITRYENGAVQDIPHDLLIRQAADLDSFAKIYDLRKNQMDPADVAKLDEVFERGLSPSNFTILKKNLSLRYVSYQPKDDYQSNLLSENYGTSTEGDDRKCRMLMH